MNLRRSHPTTDTSTHRWQRWTLRALVGGLIALHAVLLVRRLASPDGFTDPEALLRWLGSAALLAGTLAWRRAARSARGGLRSRPGHGARVFWTVAALLHAGIGVQPAELQVEVASGLLWILAAWGFLTASAVPYSATRRLEPRPVVRRSACSDPARGARCAPRPPPFAIAS